MAFFYLFCAYVFKYPWDYATHTTHLTVKPPHIYLLYSIYNVSTNQALDFTFLNPTEAVSSRLCTGYYRGLDRTISSLAGPTQGVKKL